MYVCRVCVCLTGACGAPPIFARDENSHVNGMTVHAFAGVGVSDSTSLAGFVAAARRPAGRGRAVVSQI